MYRVSIGRIAFALCLGVLGCASPDENADDDQSIVVTRHAVDADGEDRADFSRFGTFHLRPTIKQVKDGEIVDVDDAVATPLLEATSRNMEERGYVAEADPATAELGVEMLYLDQVNSAYYCYSWWDPYYWGYPGWGYYPYYGWCDGTVWKSGALVTVITNQAVPVDEGKRIPGIWFSGVYAVSLSAQQAIDGIDQAFIQSPYIETDVNDN